MHLKYEFAMHNMYFAFKYKNIVIRRRVFKIHPTNAYTIYINQFCFWPACNSLPGGQQD